MGSTFFSESLTSGIGATFPTQFGQVAHNDFYVQFVNQEKADGVSHKEIGAPANWITDAQRHMS